MKSKSLKEMVLNQLHGITSQVYNQEFSSDILEEISDGICDLKCILNRKETKVRNSDDTVFIWSDGACSRNPGPGGWGTIIQSIDEYQELSGFSPKTTNNIMELTGALEGIKRTPPNSKIELTSDSRYLTDGMKSWIHGWKKRQWKKADGSVILNKEIWMELDQVAQERNITWKWVKGHANHPQNERCDELARQAIKKQIMTELVTK